MLELTDVRASYGDDTVLNGISLNVGRGEVVCLLGRNGAGKTTVALTIMGYLNPHTGQIRLNGEDIGGRRPHRIARRGVGFVPQERCIFPSLTVRENITVCARSDNNIWTLDRLFSIFPRLGERQNNFGSQLSGGEQQLLAIARALSLNPKILVLDEPQEGLAPIIVQDIIRVMRELKGLGLSILLIEQALDVALEIGDRHYVLNKGSVKFTGTSDELGSNETVLRNYLAV